MSNFQCTSYDLRRSCWPSWPIKCSAKRLRLNEYILTILVFAIIALVTVALSSFCNCHLFSFFLSWCFRQYHASVNGLLNIILLQSDYRDHRVFCNWASRETRFVWYFFNFRNPSKSWCDSTMCTLRVGTNQRKKIRTFPRFLHSPPLQAKKVHVEFAWQVRNNCLGSGQR